MAILAAAVPRWTLENLLATVTAVATPGPLVYLDGVQNPHNLGSILRTAAHFGAAAIVGRAGELPPLSPAGLLAGVLIFCDRRNRGMAEVPFEQDGRRLPCTR